MKDWLLCVLFLLLVGLLGFLAYQEKVISPKERDVIIMRGATRFCSFLVEEKNLPETLMPSCMLDMYHKMRTPNEMEKEWELPPASLTPFGQRTTT